MSVPCRVVCVLSALAIAIEIAAGFVAILLARRRRERGERPPGPRVAAPFPVSAWAMIARIIRMLARRPLTPSFS